MQSALRGIFPCIYIIITLFQFPNPGYAQTAVQEIVDGIQVRLSLDKTDLVVGEPLNLAVSITNISDMPVVEVTSSVQLPEGNDVSVTVQPPDELAYRYTGAVEEGAYPGLVFKLDKNQTRTFHLILLYDRTQPSGVLFSTEGTYGLAVDFSFYHQNSPNPLLITLPPVEIKVKRPTVPSGIEEKMPEPELIRALHLGAISTTGILEQVLKMAADNPLTNYGNLALRTAGLYTIYQTPDQLETGARMLRQYLSGKRVGKDGDRVAWSLARAYHTDRQYEVARGWMYYLQKNFPDSIYLRSEDPLYNYYLAGPKDFADQVPWYLLKSPWIIPGATPPSDLRPTQKDY